MPCYGPLQAFRPKDDAPNKRLVFKKTDSHSGIPILVPCGRCHGCKLEHSRQWAVRCMHEKRMHTNSAFLTLTYDDAHLPSGGTLVKRDLQLFMKSLRHVTGPGLRFFGCGEYGEKNGRPHYHVLLLSHTIPNLRPAKSSLSRNSDFPLYESSTLSNLWQAGTSLVGDVTFESAAYVARYCLKKISGEKAADHYKGRTPEFLVMSRRPGIGASYLAKYNSEILTNDNVIVNGMPSAIPRYYGVRLTDNIDQNMNNFGCLSRLAVLKIARRRKIDRTDKSLRRLRVKEIVSLAKLLQKGRKL